MRLFKLHKKGIMPVIVLSLLLFIIIVNFFYFQAWYNDYLSSIEVLKDQKSLVHSLEVIKLDESDLYLSNDFKDNLDISKIIINGSVCGVDNWTVSLGVSKLNISLCSGLVPLTIYDVIIETDYGIKFELEILRNSTG